jgi:dienelactone hydrolase
MVLPRVDVEFTSQDTTLRGWLYRAVGPGPHPGVVMAHGLSAVKEMFLDRYAEAFAAAGYTPLAYPHL